MMGKRSAPAQLQELNAAEAVRTGCSICLQTDSRSGVFTEVLQRNRGEVPAPRCNSGNSRGTAKPLISSGTTGIHPRLNTIHQEAVFWNVKKRPMYNTDGAYDFGNINKCQPWKNKWEFRYIKDLAMFFRESLKSKFKRIIRKKRHVEYLNENFPPSFHLQRHVK
jgi:hypothetical protein